MTLKAGGARLIARDEESIFKQLLFVWLAGWLCCDEVMIVMTGRNGWHRSPVYF